MNLNNKVIAVTGAAQGIGLETARQLSAKGAKIALLDLNSEKLEQGIACLEGDSGAHRYYCCDVTNENQVTETFRKIAADFGRLDGLVNNAGILRDGLLIKVKDGKVVDKMSTEQYNLVIDVHLKGSFLCAREAACQMIESSVEEGCIVNLSSIAHHGNFGQSNYSAAKAGIIAQSNVWSKELGRYNIRSVAIAPGTIDTEMLQQMPEHARQKLTAMIPVQRLGQVENIAQAITSALENDYLSGGVIEINGGLSL